MKWFVPSFCGDFRLTSTDSETSLLTVKNPSAGEIETVKKFLKEAKIRGWGDSRLRSFRDVEIEINAPVGLCGPVLAVAAAAPIGQFTAVVSSGGSLTVEVNSKSAIETALAKTSQMKDDLIAAVTPKKPTLCCPHPIEGPQDHRASEALRAFCSPKQWRDWSSRGWLIAYGQITGHAYRVAHRKSHEAVAQGKIAYDLDDSRTVHCWDWTVPPAEEVLAVKLLLEGREPWLRNPAGNNGPAWGRSNFRNPLGHDVQDGTDNAGMFKMMGQALVQPETAGSTWNGLADGSWDPMFGYLGD